MPKAMFVALGLVLLVEIVLHIMPGDWLLGYGPGLGSYYDVLHTLQTRGPAQVSVLGTSRGRESIVQPLLREMVRERLGKEITVANYSLAGAHADEMHRVARLMFAGAEKPEIVLYFVSPKMIKADPPDHQRLGILGVFPDVLGGRIGQILAAQSEEPLWRLRQWLDGHYYTFRYRHRIRWTLTAWARGRRPESAVQGDFTTWQRYGGDRSLATHPVSAERIDTYASQLMNGSGVYCVGEDQLAAVAATAELCRTHGVPFVLLEAAISEDLQEHFPTGVTETFTNALQSTARTVGVEVQTMSMVGADLDHTDFREQSHLNRQGGEKVTRALADRFILPAIRLGE